MSLIKFLQDKINRKIGGMLMAIPVVAVLSFSETASFEAKEIFSTVLGVFSSDALRAKAVGVNGVTGELFQSGLHIDPEIAKNFALKRCDVKTDGKCTSFLATNGFWYVSFRRDGRGYQKSNIFVGGGSDKKSARTDGRDKCKANAVDKEDQYYSCNFVDFVHIQNPWIIIYWNIRNRLNI